MMTVHLFFGRKDGDLIQWRACLPPKMLSRYIVAVLEAEINQTLYRGLPVPEQISAIYIPEQPYSCVVNIRNVVVEQYLLSIPKYHRNDVIKQVLRKNIFSAFSNPVQNLPIPALATVPVAAAAPRRKTKQESTATVSRARPAIKPQNPTTGVQKPSVTEKPKEPPARRVVRLETQPRPEPSSDREKDESAANTLKNALLALAGD